MESDAAPPADAVGTGDVTAEQQAAADMVSEFGRKVVSATISGTQLPGGVPLEWSNCVVPTASRQSS